MLVLFLFSLMVLLYMFLGYPLILWVLSVLFGKKVGQKEIEPSVSLIISAYNEEKCIREKIENSLALDYPSDKLEVIVASESTDKTNAIALEYKNRGIVLYNYSVREGKRVTLYRTVPKAKGEIIVFSDANAMYKKDAIRKIVRNFADPRIGCVSGRLRYTSSEDSSIGQSESNYWEFEFLLKRMASKLFSLSGGVNGSIFAVRKELYNPIDKYRGDDFEIACRVQLDGHGVVLEPEALSFEEPSRNSQEEFGRKVRLASWNFKSTLLLLDEAFQRKRVLTAFILFSHRFLRYTTPVWLILLFFANSFLTGGPLRYVFLAQLAFFFTAALGLLTERLQWKVNSVFLAPFYFCMLNYAALISLMKNILNSTDMLWEKSR